MNKKENIILSNKKTIIEDKDKNIINLENFNYQKTSKIFKSIGLVEILDKQKNSYNFSQILY